MPRKLTTAKSSFYQYLWLHDTASLHVQYVCVFTLCGGHSQYVCVLYTHAMYIRMYVHFLHCAALYVWVYIYPHHTLMCMLPFCVLCGIVWVCSIMLLVFMNVLGCVYGFVYILTVHMFSSDAASEQ